MAGPGAGGVFVRTGGAVTLGKLAGRDPCLAHLGLVAAILLVAPIFFSIRDAGGGFLPVYVDVMLFAFSWPLMALAVMAVHRLYRLERLVERGEQRVGTVRQVKRRKGMADTVEIAFRVGAEERTAKAYKSLAMTGYVEEGSELDILVDPSSSPAPAVILAARAGPGRELRIG